MKVTCGNRILFHHYTYTNCTVPFRFAKPIPAANCASCTILELRSFSSVLILPLSQHFRLLNESVCQAVNM